MSSDFRDTKIWKCHLEAVANDPHAEAKSLLRSAYLEMRENAKLLVSLIPRDCHDLTVHDVSHLDALWEMADTIAGDKLAITPVEAFVFGAAVLLHDSGMTVASYQNGMRDIVETIEYKDIVASVARRHGLTERGIDLQNDLPEEIKQEVLFNVLRLLHARNAEKLISVYWKHPGDERQMRLLQNDDLLDAYGDSIGRIAHSHHWPLQKLVAELRDQVGARARIPSDWTLDERKVACLLRCADAAHVDYRRAPALLYALTRPKGVSKEHWSFQSKLNRPVLDGNVLKFASGSQFTPDEANARWLCYDTIKMINNEIASCNAYMEDAGIGCFAATRVYGANNPAVLSKAIRPSGWKPVVANVSASDPVSLARTLGGRNLYGSSIFPPIRELLQNAVDAVRARRAIENRSSPWGNVRLIVEEKLERNSPEIWLHVDDNGIGMSERILTGQLIDFGKSVWNSSLLGEEYPGLDSSGIYPIGKFGIGFFSVFLLGGTVRVVSRKCDAAAIDTRVLEFNSLDSRPLLRDAVRNELPLDFSTRVSVKIDEIDQFFREGDDVGLMSARQGNGKARNWQHLLSEIKRLVACIDLEVEVKFDNKGIGFRHSGNWFNESAEEFLEKILPEDLDNVDKIVAMHADRVAPILDEGGAIAGRGVLNIALPSRSFRAVTATYASVGGFLYPVGGAARTGLYGLLEAFIGVVPGKANVVTREYAVPDVCKSVLSRWITEQGAKLEHGNISSIHKIEIARRIVELKGDPGSLPICVNGGKLISLETCCSKISALDRIVIPIDKFADTFTSVALAKAKAEVFEPGMREEVFLLGRYNERSRLLTDSATARILEGGDNIVEERDIARTGSANSLTRLVACITKVWGSNLLMKVESIQLYKETLYFPPEESWALVVRKMN